MLQKHPKCDEALDLLFDTAGASILRNIVGDGGVWGDETNGPTPTIEPEEGVWQFEGDEEQVWAAREALKRRGEKKSDGDGVEPARLDENERLRPRRRRAASRQVSGVCGLSLALRARVARPFRHRTVRDLPGQRAGSCDEVFLLHLERRTVPRLRADYLAPTFQKDGVTAKVVMPETTSCVAHVEDYTNLIFADEAATAAVDIVGLHGYGHDTVIAPVRGAAEHGKKVWQTELCDINVMEEWQRGDGIVNGIFWAENIDNYLTRMGVSA